MRLPFDARAIRGGTCAALGAITAALAVSLSVPGVAAAQTLGAVERRLDALEESVHRLDRKTRKLPDDIEPGGSLKAPPSAEVVAELANRLGQLERQISTLLSTQEQDRRNLEIAIDQLGRLKGDVEGRFDTLEKEKTAAAALPPPPPPPPPTPVFVSPDDRFAEALAFANAKDWTKAEFAFDAFIANNPGHPKIPEASYWLGKALDGQGKYALAAQKFLQVFEKYSQHPIIVTNLIALGSALEKLGPDSVGQACLVYNQIEDGYKDALTPEIRNTLLERRLADGCKSDK